jgi:hypothetical protein
MADRAEVRGAGFVCPIIPESAVRQRVRQNPSRRRQCRFKLTLSFMLGLNPMAVMKCSLTFTQPMDYSRLGFVWFPEENLSKLPPP